MFRTLTGGILLALLASPVLAQNSAVGTPALQPAVAAMAAPAPSPVCFLVTMQCFKPKVAAADAQPSRLDLRAPPIAAVVPQAELQVALADPDEPKYDEESSIVKVEGERDGLLDIPVGIMAIPWAARHPSQAWRIFLPTPSRMKSKDED